MIYAYKKCKMQMLNFFFIIFFPPPPKFNPVLTLLRDTHFPRQHFFNTPSHIDYDSQNLTGYINKTCKIYSSLQFQSTSKKCVITFKGGSEKSLQQKNKHVYNYTVLQIHSNLIQKSTCQNKIWKNIINKIIQLKTRSCILQ